MTSFYIISTAPQKPPQCEFRREARSWWRRESGTVWKVHFFWHVCSNTIYNFQHLTSYNPGYGRSVADSLCLRFTNNNWLGHLTNRRRFASLKGGVWENESPNESFGSRWANQLKINAYYKTNKVFFYPCMHVKLFLGTPKTKIGIFQMLW